MISSLLTKSITQLQKIVILFPDIEMDNNMVLPESKASSHV